jgi:hypothetical protein
VLPDAIEPGWMHAQRAEQSKERNTL